MHNVYDGCILFRIVLQEIRNYSLRGTIPIPTRQPIINFDKCVFRVQMCVHNSCILIILVEL